MPLPAADRNLRRLVAELATTTKDDVAAVLAGLEERQRERVEALLAEYRGPEASPAGGGDRRQPVIVSDLSPWLADRWARSNLDGARGGEATQIWSGHDLSYSMTPTALAALREAVLSVERSAPPTSDQATSAGWLTGLAALLRRIQPQ